MKNNPKSYKAALEEIQSIQTELQADLIDVDELVDKIKRAELLLKFCKEKLRNAETDLDQLLNEKEVS